MDDMAELLNFHEVINMHCEGLAYTVHVVTSKIDKHDVFCPILSWTKQFSAESFILYERMETILDTEDYE